MKLIFQALKIDSWVISPTAKYRLQQVGIDEDGNVTLNKQKVEEMPNLINRLKKTNPNWSINKYTVYNKIKESELHNINNINYTLRYEKPTKMMKTTAKQSNYSKGKDIYGTNYGKGSNSSSSSGKSKSKNKASKTTSASGTRRPPEWVCSSVKSTSINAAMKVIWSYNRGYASSYQDAIKAITNYAATYPAAYKSQASPCLDTLAKYCIRSDKKNAAKLVKAKADAAYNQSKGLFGTGRGTSSQYRSRGNQVRGASSNKKTSKKNNGWWPW